MRLSLPRLAGYSFGAFGTGVFSTVPTVLLLYFCTETLRIPPELAGVAVFVPKVWALIWDPVVGIVSDRTRSPIGRRRPYLLLGAIGVSVAFFTLFAWPYPTGAAAFVPVALLYFALANAYSLFAVPYIAVPAEVSNEPAARERMTAWRIGFAMVGVLIGAALAPMLVQQGGGGRSGYLLMATIITAICGLGMLSAFLSTPSRLGGTPSSPPLKGAIPLLLRNRPFLKLIGAYVLQLTGVGLISALTPYWVVHVAKRSEGIAGLALGVLLIATILTTPVWALVMRWLGARRTIAAAAFLYGLATLGFLALPYVHSPYAAWALYAAIGVPFAGVQVGPFALAAHLIHRAAAVTGARQEGLYTGLWTAGEKLGLALGPGVAGLALAVIGFRSGGASQGPETLSHLNLAIAAGPTLFLWASLALLGAGKDKADAPPPRPRKVSDFVSDAAARTPDAEATVIGERRWTYAALNARIDALARALVAAGVKRGDRVATLCTPHPDYIAAFLATASIGAIWVGLNPRYQIGELAYVMGDAEPRILIARSRIDQRDYAADLAALMKQTPSIESLVILGGDPVPPGAVAYDAFVERGGTVRDAALEAARAGVGGRDPCMIVYTSGSTGKPKGALLHHEGIAAFSVAQNRLWPVSPLRILNYFPINHIGCVVDVSVPALAAGGAIVFLEQFDPAEAMRLTASERCTLWGSVPSVLQMQLALPDFDAYDLSAVQLILWEGAAMPEPTLDRLLKMGPPLATNYSMTETSAAITATPPTRDREVLAHSVGSVFDGMEVRLVRADGVDAADGEPGEVWARSAYNMLGYWRKPAETAEAITPDGWFKTGDTAVKRSDGRYRIVGRIKEMYKSGGYNVYPREVEDALLTHPAVTEAAVVGVPDPLWGESGVAFVVLRSAVDPAALEAHCRGLLANYKVPKRFVVRDSLPLLPIGKVDKVALKALAMEADPAPAAASQSASE